MLNFITKISTYRFIALWNLVQPENSVWHFFSYFCRRLIVKIQFAIFFFVTCKLANQMCFFRRCVVLKYPSVNGSYCFRCIHTATFTMSCQWHAQNGTESQWKWHFLLSNTRKSMSFYSQNFPNLNDFLNWKFTFNFIAESNEMH